MGRTKSLGQTRVADHWIRPFDRHSKLPMYLLKSIIHTEQIHLT